MGQQTRETGVLALAQKLPFMLVDPDSRRGANRSIADRACGTGAIINFRDKQEITL